MMVKATKENRRLKRAVFLLCALLVSLLFSQEIADAQTAAPVCDGVTTICLSSAPALLDVAGATYLLTQDVTSTGDGYRIAADNVTLDGQGFTLTTAAGIGFSVFSQDVDNATIKNLVVRRGFRAWKYALHIWFWAHDNRQFH